MTISQPVGDIYDPLGAHANDPYPLYAVARQTEPIFYSPRLGAWVVTRYEDVLQVLKDTDTFSSRNALRPLFAMAPEAAAEFANGFPHGPSLTDGDGELHHRLRGPIARGLGLDRVRALEPRITQRANQLVDTFIEDGQVEFMQAFATPLPFEVILDVFDIPEIDRPTARDGAHQTMRWLHDPLTPTEQVQAVRGTVALQHLIADRIKQRRDQPGQDLISETAATLAPGGGPLEWQTLAELVAALFTVVMAGHVTTVDLLGLSLRHLLSQRDRWELLVGHPERIEDAVEELVRYDTPVQAFFRITTRDTRLGEVELPAGTEVLIVYGSANRDETRFEEADRLELTREPTRHLAFAFGKHFCAGAWLARAEMRIALETLTRRLPSLRLVPDQTVEYTPNVRLRGPRRLLLAWD